MTQCSERHDRAGGRLAGLLALNGALLAVLLAVTFGPSVGAQARVRADYTMAAGRSNGAPSGTVFIVDTVNQELIALSYEPNQKNLIGVVQVVLVLLDGSQILLDLPTLLVQR